MSARKVRTSRVGLVAASVAAFLFGAGFVGVVQIAAASGSNTTYRACLSPRGALSRVGTNVPACPAGSRTISWSSTGPQGPRGMRGLQGAQDLRGATGPAGAAGAKGPAGTAYSCSASPYPGIDLADCTFTGAELAGSSLDGANLTAAV